MGRWSWWRFTCCCSVAALVACGSSSSDEDDGGGAKSSGGGGKAETTSTGGAGGGATSTGGSGGRSWRGRIRWDGKGYEHRDRARVFAVRRTWMQRRPRRVVRTGSPMLLSPRRELQPVGADEGRLPSTIPRERLQLRGHALCDDRGMCREDNGVRRECAARRVLRPHGGYG